jgi:hypothetical protein
MLVPEDPHSVNLTGRPCPNDPTRPIVTLKTSWNNVRKKAGVSGRWHDNRHTLITDLAESGAGDETKRKALEAIVPKPALQEHGDPDSISGDPIVPTTGTGRPRSTTVNWTLGP